MKKIIIIYILCAILLLFMPIFLVKNYDYNSTTNLDEIKIKLLLTETNEVKEMSLDDYIIGVLIGEMPATYEEEALKAQAIVARTYTLNKIINAPGSHTNADMCDDVNHCQAYKTKEYAFNSWDDNEENDKWEKIKNAVIETQNKVITYQNNLINAFFFSNSGGKTEDISNVWGHEEIPYLKSVDGLEDDVRAESVTLTYEELDNLMKEKYINYASIIDDSSAKTIEELQELIKVTEINSSGRVSKIQVSNIIMEGTEARSVFNLRSTLFEIELTNNEIIFHTKGYGHGVGLSQVGANCMAQKGASCEEIIKHYYTGVEISEYKENHSK